MSWKDEPATSAQLVTIREYYAKAIGWNNAQALIMARKQNGMTKGQASEEIARLQALKAKGQWTGPED